LHASGNYNREPKVLTLKEEPEVEPADILMAAYSGDELSEDERAEALRSREEFWKKQEKRRRDTND
ncbi:MAG: hypothetical protein GX924_07720, partial [Clostridiaceae bacterium]|nr:hypothetical protein [Clostridiaceae bacterium]